MVHLFRLALALAFLGTKTCLAQETAVNATVTIETPYNHLTVERFGSVVELRSRWKSTLYRESAVDLRDPAKLIVPYTRYIAASACFRSQPKNVLMLGLGGGGFNQYFTRMYPGAALETVELDPQVLEAAKAYLRFTVSPRNRVTIQDGRMFLRRNKEQYDWIILDAFRGGFAPPHLKTAEFYQIVKAHLAPQGILVANVQRGSALFASDLRTVASVFPQAGYFELPETANAVLVAANYPAPALRDTVRRPFAEQDSDVFRHSLEALDFAASFHPVTPDTYRSAALLTDDFSPSEFLDAVKTSNTAE